MPYERLATLHEAEGLLAASVVLRKPLSWFLDDKNFAEVLRVHGDPTERRKESAKHHPAYVLTVAESSEGLWVWTDMTAVAYEDMRMPDRAKARPLAESIPEDWTPPSTESPENPFKNGVGWQVYSRRGARSRSSSLEINPSQFLRSVPPRWLIRHEGGKWELRDLERLDHDSYATVAEAVESAERSAKSWEGGGDEGTRTPLPAPLIPKVKNPPGLVASSTSYYKECVASSTPRNPESEMTSKTEPSAPPALNGTILRSGPREYVVVTRKYAVIRDLVEATPFSWDEATGYQRPLDSSHVANLAKAMQEGAYTPTPWTASVTTADAVERTGNKARILADAAKRLALVDGNHRLHAMHRLFEANPDAAADIDVTLTILLDPDHLPADFLRLQAGRQVNRNLLKSLEVAAGLIPEEQGEVTRHATDAIRLLAKSTRSWMTNGVSWQAGESSKLQYATLISTNKSSIATAVLGGSYIALPAGKSPEWLSERYCDAYEAIQTYGTADGGGVDAVRRVFGPDRLLTPLSLGGKKVGSHLLIGVANVFAWRLIYENKDVPTEDDATRLADSVEATLNKPYTGGSAEDKRRWVGAFARHFTKDMESTPRVDGLPVALIEALSPSSLGVDIAKWKEHKAGTKPPKKPKNAAKKKRGQPKGSRNKAKDDKPKLFPEAQ